MRGLGVVLSLLVVTAGSARAQERARRIGVVAAVYINLEEGEAASIAADLGEALREELVVDVVAGGEARRRLPEGGIPDQCFLDRECLSEVGGRLDAEEILFLVMVRVGDEIQIDTVWAEVASGESASRRGLVLEGEGGRSELFAEAAPALLPDAPRRPPTRAAPSAPAAPGSADVGGGAAGAERDRRGRRMTAGVWIAGGAAALALAGGIGFGLSAKRIDDRLAADGCDRAPCEDASARVSRMRRRMIAADVLYGVSAAAAVTAAVLYWRSGRDAGAPVEVGAGPGAAGLSVRGRF